MPKHIATLEHEIRDWQHYKKYGSWINGTRPYKTFTHSVADEQIKKREVMIEKRKAAGKAGGTRRRRHRTRRH